MIAEPTDLLDSIWGFFLQDHEDKDSVGSQTEFREELGSRADGSGEYYSRNGDGDEWSKFSALTDYSKKKRMARDPSLRRTKQLLEYARQLEAAKMKAARARRVTFSGRVSFVGIPEDRESDLKDDACVDDNRVGPPQMIFVRRDDDPSYTESDEETDDDSRNAEEVSTNASSQKKPSGDSNSRMNDIIARRKALHRRIALLRIKAAKVRMANADA